LHCIGCIAAVGHNGVVSCYERITVSGLRRLRSVWTVDFVVGPHAVQALRY